ncbi:MAG: HemK/PrmC family methyltransferase [Patescibacteria group bacterium]
MKNQEKAWLLKEKYQGVESSAFNADCVRLEAGVPLAYLIGSVPFLDCTIHLDSYPLIPRPETEYWVEKAITAIRVHSSRRDLERTTEGGPASSLKILDLCAGSGAIGVAVAKAESSAHVTFAELDPAHLPTIEKNILSNLSVNRKVGENEINIISGDLFENVPPGQKFDFILTNPPYIDAAANTVDTNVVEQEPHLALFGGDSGMEIIARIITCAPLYLTPIGQLWIEHEPAQVAEIASLALEHGFSIITHPDQYGVPRFSVLTMAQ